MRKGEGNDYYEERGRKKERRTNLVEKEITEQGKRDIHENEAFCSSAPCFK